MRIKIEEHFVERDYFDNFGSEKAFEMKEMDRQFEEWKENEKRDKNKMQITNLNNKDFETRLSSLKRICPKYDEKMVEIKKSKIDR